MADHFLPGLENLKHSFSLADSDPNMEFINHLSGIYQNHQHPSSLNIHGLMGLSPDNLFPPLPQSPGLFIDQDNTLLPHNIISNSNDDGDHIDRKRKAMEISTPGNSPANSSPQGSDNGIRRKNSVGRGKRVKGNEKKEEKSMEVVHVRAKRGQATDSHSLAERVRREKINDRLRCLQDIVPGCYKTMGMAVMLDEIINYVQSLQNQVDFLSMKLTAASTFYDFNSEADALETLQRQKAFEALKIQNGSIQLGLPPAQFPPLDLTFACNPHLPHNR